MSPTLDTDETGDPSTNPVSNRVMTPEKLAAIIAAAKRLRENPLFKEYLASIEEYRREHNTVPDAD